MHSNEEYSAFHAQAIVEQARYANQAIRHILAKTKTSSQSIVVLAHSMGGIVARKLIALKEYVPGSISAMYTLATPHVRAPVALNGALYNLYQELNSKLHGGSEKWKDLVLVSIAGGNEDSLVTSDSTDTSIFLDPAHGFSVYSTGIPRVWTSADHKAILWCNQLVKVIAQSLMYDLFIVPSPEYIEGNPFESREVRLARLEKRFQARPRLSLGMCKSLTTRNSKVANIHKRESIFPQRADRRIV